MIIEKTYIYLLHQNVINLYLFIYEKHRKTHYCKNLINTIFFRINLFIQLIIIFNRSNMKTLDINVKTWRDKMYGNTYFAGTFVTNYGLETEKTYLLPFQYGYGEQCIQEVTKLLTEFNIISLPDYENLRNFCKLNNIVLRFNMHENCKKSELKNIVTQYNKNL